MPALVSVACGGDAKKPKPKKPVIENKDPEPPPETAEDRAAKREKLALAMIPADSTCLPIELKEKDAPRLELAAVGSDAVICAMDTDAERMLGVVGCWKIDLASGELAYRSREAVAGRGQMVKIDGKCANGLCLPKDSPVPDDHKALITTSPDGTKHAMLVGDDVHIYDGEKAHETAWSIRGDKGVAGVPTRINWVGQHIFVEAGEVFVFKADDGAPVGPIQAIGAKDGKGVAGSFVILDKNRVAISQNGFSTVTTYEADTGKRAKLVRKLPRTPCKSAETEAYWKSEEVPAKCKDHMDKTFSHLLGADAVAGSKNLLVLLRGPRLGELAVLDARSLAEKKAIRLVWCEAKASGGDGDDEKAEKKDAQKDSKDDDDDDD